MSKPVAETTALEATELPWPCACGRTNTAWCSKCAPRRTHPEGVRWDGHPENPERDGWHWMSMEPRLWLARGEWDMGDGSLRFTPEFVVRCGHTYQGPCLMRRQRHGG